MADFAPPSGPPPPKVPEGWKAIWNSQYNEWFYVNTYTKKSQWDKPDAPVYPPTDSSSDAPGGPPPAYQDTGAKVGPEKGGLPGGDSHVSEDERLARQLQEEENRRAGGPSSGAPGTRGEADAYYVGGSSQYQQNPPYQQQGGLGIPPQNDGRLSSSPSPSGEKRRSFLGKIFDKHKQPQQQHQYPPPGYPPQGYPQQGFPPQGYYPPQGYGQQGPYMQPGRKPGLGAGGAAALGVGGGLLGGMMLEQAFDGHDGGGYGGDDGGDYGGDGGGDFGGGDFGGGDMGGGDF